jgi:drug/metabolite transporter (DMT)-like permease
MSSLWMLAAGLAFALMSVCVKFASTSFSAAELVFWRSLGTLAMSALLLLRKGLPLSTTRLGMHTHRGVAGFVSLFMFFYALTELPIATAMTLNYTSPLFVAVLFTALTRERIGGKLAAALGVGFAGAALLLRPSIGEYQWWPALVGLGSGALAAVAYWNVQRLVRANEPVERVVFYFALYSTAGAFVWMLPQKWHPVTGSVAWSLAGVALFGTIGQILLTEAYGKGRALVSAALSYSGIVFTSILGIVVFDERLPTVAWVGIALIVAAGIMALRFGPRRSGPDPLVTND